MMHHKEAEEAWPLGHVHGWLGHDWSMLKVKWSLQKSLGSLSRASSASAIRANVQIYRMPHHMSKLGG